MMILRRSELPAEDLIFDIFDGVFDRAESLLMGQKAIPPSA
jgi:hypothetical protein